jgi:hypothetical protein
VHDRINVQNNPVNFVDPEGLWSVRIAVYWGYGGSITFGSSGGKNFVRVGGGVGYGGGVSFNPFGSFPDPPEGSDCSKPHGFIGASGWAGVGVGPVSAGWAGYAGGAIGQRSNGQPTLGYTQGGGFYGSVSGKAGWGLKAGLGANLVDVGIAW